MPIPTDIRTLTLFVPCYVDYLHPRAGLAAVHVLESLGHELRVERRAVCCGQPLTNSGCTAEGAATTQAWYRAMEGSGTVVVLSSSCTVHLSHNRPRAEDLPQVVEICEFLCEHHADRISGELEAKMCFHSACHGLRESQSNRAAKELLGRIDGLEIVQAERPDECCGFGGTFSTAFPNLSIAMGRDRLSEIQRSGSRDVVATDISCLLHLQGIARAQGQPLHIRHVVEVLNEARP